MKYYFSKTIKSNFEDAISRTTEALKKEGFGVLSQIRIDQKLNEKLGVEFRPYIILGACHPASAYKALQNEDKIGTMLPCNVIIQQIAENQMEVSAVDPIASMMAIENSGLGEVATDVAARLKRVVNEHL